MNKMDSDTERWDREAQKPPESMPVVPAVAAPDVSLPVDEVLQKVAELEVKKKAEAEEKRKIFEKSTLGKLIKSLRDQGLRTMERETMLFSCEVAADAYMIREGEPNAGKFDRGAFMRDFLVWRASKEAGEPVDFSEL